MPEKKSLQAAKKNHLAGESSPYLLQHAENPVNWFPWGDEAFALAREEDKPIFLSIGYATCHWCHVMEHESFEDEEVADLLNADFVPVKVDREERPDVDAVYMAVTQALTGSGGWPMTVLLTPEKKPFFAGTYFPKRGGRGRPGMLELLPAMAKAWQNRRDDIEKAAAEITVALQKQPLASSSTISETSLGKTETQLLQAYDDKNGGFGTAPKFPSPVNLLFLLRRYRRNRNLKTLKSVVHTLTAMRLGGLYDHLGYGFHRYSTDSAWLVPHFEKMLYDQALLIMVYTEAYQVTGNDLFARTVHETIEYVQREMTNEDGGFFSAEDADSEGVEGKYYIWTKDEIDAVLGDAAEAFCAAYGVADAGNYADEATGAHTGANILHLQSVDALDEFCEARKVLFQHREKRVHPLKDDKILTDWNALMIAALAKAAIVFEQPEYRRMAEHAANFIATKLQHRDGRLKKRFRRGVAGLPPTVNDYAFTIWGLFELYQASCDITYLRNLQELAVILLEDFQDPDNKGLYMTSTKVKHLPIRHQDVYDGALPSGNSVSAWNFLRLYHLTGNSDFRDAADGIFSRFSQQVDSYPMGFTMMMVARDFAAGPVQEIVIAGNPEEESTQALLNAVQAEFRPLIVYLLKTHKNKAKLAELAEFTAQIHPQNEGGTAYLCSGFRCEQPIRDPEVLKEHLR